MSFLKDKLEEFEQEHMARVTDPRLKLPGVTFYGQSGLGCGFAIVSFLPFAALAVYLFVDDPEAVRLVQWFLLGFIGFWMLTWVMNYQHVGKLRRKGKPGTAVVVDKFTYKDDEGDTMRVLVYETEHPQTGAQTRVIGHVQMPREFEVHVGQSIKFLRLPTSKILTSISSRAWPEMWSLMPKDKLANQVTGFAVISGILLTLASLAGFWVRTTMLAFQFNWSDVFNNISDRSLMEMLTSLDLQFWYCEAAGRYWILLATAGVAVVTVIGAAFFQVVGMFGEE